MTFNALQALHAFGTGQQMAQQKAELARRASARSAMSEYILAPQVRASRASTDGPLVGNNPAELRTPVVGEFASPDPTAANLMAYGAQGAAPPSLAQPSVASRLMTAGQAAMSPRDAAFQRLARADPESALKVRQEYAELDDQKLKNWNALNEGGLRILSGVYDQRSFDEAKLRARSLYERYGEDPEVLAGLPEQYSPEAVNAIRMEMMSAKDQFGTLRAERKLEWDIEDDEIDNERADRNLESLSEYRQGSLANVRRGQDLTDDRGRRGQHLASGDRQRGQNLSDTRGRRGQDLTNARGLQGQALTDKRVRESAGFSGRGRRGGAAAAPVARIRNPQTGQVMVLRGGKWVAEQ